MTEWNQILGTNSNMSSYCRATFSIQQGVPIGFITCIADDKPHTSIQAMSRMYFISILLQTLKGKEPAGFVFASTAQLGKSTL